MRRRAVLVVLAGALSLTGTAVAGAISAAATTIPPVCVTQPVGPTQIEVGYCPYGPS